VQGEPPEGDDRPAYRDRIGTVGPVLLFMGLVLGLGLYIPPPLEALLREAAALVEVSR
jgi:hydrogenase-4 component F